MINYAAEDKEFTFYQRNGIIKNWTIYRTSDKDGENLLPVGSIKNHEKVVIPARSIITLVTQYISVLNPSFLYCFPSPANK